MGTLSYSNFITSKRSTSLPDKMRQIEFKGHVFTASMVSAFLIAVIVCSFLGIVIGYASQLICNVIGFIYPAYESIKAIETANSKDDTKWLTYWVVYSSFIIVEFFSDYLLYWIPFYFFLKIGLLIWCMHPNYNGTTFIYNTVIRPVFLQNEKRVDNLLTKAHEKGQAAYQKATDSAKETLNEAREEILQSDMVKDATASALQA